MTDIELLNKVIDKAIKNGYKVSFIAIDLYYSIIFSHDFAKAFFGEKDEWYDTKCTCGGLDFHAYGHDAHKMGCAKTKCSRGYLFHLKQMVVYENPLEYLEKFL
jgi:hypothetical protein